MQKWQNTINYLVAVLIILSLNFILPRLMPGDPLTAIYGDEALIQMTPQLKARLVEQLAIDKPLWEQFIAYLMSLFKGDFGYSYYYNAPVLKVIFGALPWTLILVGSSLLLSTIIGIIMGVESGWRRGKTLDKSLLSLTMVLNGFPDFFLGAVLLIIFGVTLKVLPLAGALTPYSGYTGFSLIIDAVKHLILPVASLTMVNITGAYLLTRNTMVSTIEGGFIMTARAKGLKDRIIRYRHAGKNSMLPVITRTGIQIGRLITGALFVETVFSYPGIGMLVQNALKTRDYPLLQGAFFIVALFILVSNFVTDKIYKLIDPRLR